jgi:hypothetical protein
LVFHPSPPICFHQPFSHSLQNLEDTHSLRAHREALLYDLWSEFQRECKRYDANTKDRKVRFEVLKKKDEESSHTIARQMRKLHKLQESIASLKHRMVLNAKESEEKTRAIRQVSVSVPLLPPFPSHLSPPTLLSLLLLPSPFSLLLSPFDPYHPTLSLFLPLPQDREALLTHFHTLKQEMNICRAAERNSLTTLTLQSDAAIKELERKRDKVSLTRD